MPEFDVSEIQVVLVSAVIEADTSEEAEQIFLDGECPGIETRVLDSYALTVKPLGEGACQKS